MARDSRFYADVLIDAVRFSGGIQALLILSGITGAYIKLRMPR
jgi:hypothetical protein